MFDFFHGVFAGLWPLVWHFGLAGVLVLGCAAGVYFAPTVKSKLWFVAIGGIIAVFSAAVALGVTLGEKRVRAQWDAANSAVLESAQQARADAVRTVRRKPRRWLRHNRVDPDVRD